MSFAPLRVDGGGLLQVIDVATAASAALPGATVTAGTIIGGSDTQGFYLTSTTPPGNAWTVQNRGIGAATFYRQAAAIMWSVREPDTIYAGVGNQGKFGGLLVSADKGATWQLRAAGPQFSGNTAGNPLPAPNWARSTGRLLVQDAGSNWLFAGTYAQGVLRSANNGTDNFPVACTMTGAAPGTNNWFCRSLVQLPGTPATLYAAFYDSTGATGAVWQCTNAHATTPNFTKMTGSPPTPEELLALPNGNLYACCGTNGIWQYTAAHGWRSLNSAGVDTTGSYWSALDGYTSGANDIIVAACGHTTVNAANAISLTTLSAGTGTATLANLAGTVQSATVPAGNYSWWNNGSPETFGKGGFVNPFVQFDPNDATHQAVYIAGSQGMYRSANGGATWTIANSGMPQFLAHPLAADPNHSLHVVFGDSDWGCFDDTAANGTETAATLKNNPPAHDDAQSKGVQCFSLAFDPTDSTVYAGSGRKYTNALGEIYARTWNNPGGVNTWDGGPFTGLTHGALGFGAAAGGNIAVGLCALRDPGQPSHPYVLLAAAHSGGLWRYAWNTGTSAYAWSQVSTVISAGAPLSYFVGFAHVPGSAFVYCFDRNVNKVYRSGDYGATWTATAIWTAPTAATTLSGEIAAQPLTAGELWVSSGGTLYKLTGCQAGPVVQTIVSAVASPGPVAVSPAGTLYVATLDTGTGSGLQFSVNDGATWADAVGDTSFARCNSTPEHIALGPETPPRVYVAGSNVVAAGVAATSTATSAAFTEAQSSGNLSGANGAIALYFSQAGGTGSQAGSALAVRLEASDCAMTVTGPPGWVLAAEGKAGSSTGQCRTQIWVQVNNGGGLGAPPGGAMGGQRPAQRRAAHGRRRATRTAGSAGGVSAQTGTPQVWTYSNGAAIVKGKIHEYTTPPGTIQFLDQPAAPASGGAGAVASATSLPVNTGGANTYTGGLGLAMFGAMLTGGTTGQSWTAPAGWTGDGVINNLTNVFQAAYLPADAAGTTSVTGSITLGTWTMTSWAAAACTLYALAGSPVTITTASLPDGTTGVPYGPGGAGATVAASGGAPPDTFAVTSGTLPPGLSFSAAGALSGTPTTAGTYTFSVTVTDSAAQTDTNPFTVTIASSSTLAITSGAPPPGVVGIAYGPGGAGFTLTASGGTGAGTWAITAGALPPGLTLTGAVIGGTPTAAGTYSFTVSVTDTVPTTVSAAFSIVITAVVPPPPGPAPPVTGPNSLILADQIELMGGPNGVPSVNPACAGAVFLVQPGYDLGAPVPTADFVASLILDGERPFGFRASNRTITLPIVVVAPDFGTLAGAYEVLMGAVNEQSFTLTWTRAGGAPLVLDCFRASASTVTWGGLDQKLNVPWGAIALSFTALPYGRSAEPVQILVPSPLPGQDPPPPPALIDGFAPVAPGGQWAQSTRCVTGPYSARWDPCQPPLSECTGKGSQPGALYQAALPAPVDITGLTALSVQAGFGTGYYETWHRGPAVFTFTLQDGSGGTLAFSRTMTVHASDDPGSPHWQLVTAPIPQGSAAFDYTSVTGYSLNVTNRGNRTLRFTNLYLDHLIANPPAVQPGPLIRGAMYKLLGVQGTARTTCSAQFQQAPGTAPQQTVLLPGPAGSPQTWVCPPNVTSVKVENGGAGAGGVTGGGGGGEYAAEATVGVTPLTAYTYILGAGGQTFLAGGGQPASAQNGGDTIFTGDTLAVIAHGGKAGTLSGAGGAGGTGSTNTTHHSGGAGASGTLGTAGGGGGGSAGSGGNGANASGSSGGAAGTGTTPGGAGGAGSTSDRDGYPGATPGGGGGGTSDTGDNRGAAGAPGQIKLTYTSSVAPFSTLIAHRPGPAAPADLSPLVSPGLTDVPNGLTEYPVPSLTPGVYADFNGTYTVVAVANSWHSPANSRTVTVTVKQYEYQSGPSYSTSVSRTFTPATDTFTPGGATLAQVPMVVIGELTLPLKDVAPDNASGLYTVTISDSDTADTFSDILLLDTLGETVAIGIATPGAYTNFYVDEPAPDRDLGRVMGSDFGRQQAISVLDSAIVSGGSLYLEPGDQHLLVFCVEGAPALSVTYFSRYFLERTD